MAMRTARIVLLAGLALGATPALADDLREALVLAYRTNPTLQAARAQQRATDENVPIERADGLPGLSASATHTELLHESGSSSFTGQRIRPPALAEISPICQDSTNQGQE